MEGAEDSSYLTLLNDGTHNYLLQTTEETLGVQDPSLNVESMFTEIEDGSGGWSVGLPILMNGNLISEVTDQELGTSVNLSVTNNHEEAAINLPVTALTEIYNTLGNENVSIGEEDTDATEGHNQIKYPTEIPGKGFLTADGLFIGNELLLQLKLGEGESLNLATEESANSVNGEEILINPKTLIPHDNAIVDQQGLSECSDNIQENNLDLVDECTATENEQVFDVQHLSASGDTIRLLNIDGTVININKNQLANYNISEDECIEGDENKFEVIMAHKCKKCSFLCEERNDMMQHWKKEHVSIDVQQQNKRRKVSLLSKEIKMKEIKKTEENGGAKLNNISNNGEINSQTFSRANNQGTVYLCSECKLPYNSTEKLKNHMIAAHKLVKKPSDNAANPGNKNRNGREKLTAAILEKRAKASKKIKCSVKGCDLRFSMDEMRLRHEKCHVEGQKKQFKCYECDTKFSIWRVCSMHLWKCHKVDLGLYLCPMCSVFKASSASRLLHHMEIHEDERPYLCSECGKAFKQSTQLRNHLVLHKAAINAPIPDWAAQQQCDICKKYFANSKSLKKHVQSVHDKFKPFICNVCGHKTTRKAMLDLHLRQHTGEKPHKCPICEYKTGDHNSLRRHIMRHNGDTKYSCPHCSYSSIQSVSYKNHIASKHPGLGGAYFCSLCSYHTVNENAYFNHLVDHKNGTIKDNNSNGDGNGEILPNVVDVVREEKSNSNERQSKDSTEDDETENYLLLLDHSNDVIDTGGITIPAGAPMNITY